MKPNMTLTTPWHVHFHGLVSNPTVPGGYVAMFLLHDDGGEGVLSVGVHPEGAEEIVRHICDLHNASLKS